MPQPEQQARENIDRLLKLAGWIVFEPEQANIHAGCGIAIREFPLKSGHGFADYLLYLLYVEGKAAGVIEAKPEGTTLTGVEVQSAKYTTGLPNSHPAWRNPLHQRPRARCSPSTKPKPWPPGSKTPALLPLPLREKNKPFPPWMGEQPCSESSFFGVPSGIMFSTWHS